MDNIGALEKAYAFLSPYADKQRWEFSNNLVHLDFITKYIPKTTSILDVGCGIGIIDLALILLGYKVSGADKYLFETNNSFSIDDLNGLRRVWAEQGLVILPKDILRDNLEEQYGAIISIATIEHQKDPKLFLEKILEALQPGGVLYVATPNVSHLLNRARFVFGLSPLSGHLEKWFQKGETFEGHWREYTLKELKQMFVWLDITVLTAKNKQSMRPGFRLSVPRSWYVGILRCLANLFPGTGDTNIIIGKKSLSKNMNQTGIRENEKCCVCGFFPLSPLLSLGELYFSDFIESHRSSAAHQKYPLELVLCNKKDGGCGLVQLKHFVDQEFMYRQYWYRSGVNQTMTNELAAIAKSVAEIAGLGEGDYVIDIGANDGTLLRSYAPDVQRIGFEPAKNLVAYAQKGTTYIFNDFFNAQDWQREFGDKKAKAITAIAMFYDLPDPNKFVADIASCLDDDGVFVIQMAYLPSMLTQNAFDNICHEHLQYYSLLSLEYLLKRHNLEVFDVLLNDINGGSYRIYIRHQGKGNSLRVPLGAAERVSQLRWHESELGLDERVVYDDFVRRVMDIKERLVNFIQEEKAKGKTIYVYGASTKGNTLLQFYNLDNSHIAAAAERNRDKWGRKTIGSEIPIISEEEARRRQPDYFLVLPWHFLNEFKERETEFFQNGGKFIIPLPEFEIFGKAQ